MSAITHYSHIENLTTQLKLALDSAHREYRHLAVAQLSAALASAAMSCQFYNTSDLQIDLVDLCGAPEVVAAFGHRNPAQDFEWVTFEKDLPAATAPSLD